jgi:hypothetical protein
MNKRALKMFARLDGQKRIVSNSNIWRQKMPLVGHWVEIPGYLCCNTPTYTCVTYGVTVARGDSGTYTYTPCGSLEALGPVSVSGPISLAFCAVSGSITSTGDVVVTTLGECETTTTSSTTSTTTSHS